jgi:hypothetical protein
MAQLIQPWMATRHETDHQRLDGGASVALATAAAVPVIAAGERALNVVGDWWGW